MTETKVDAKKSKPEAVRAAAPPRKAEPAKKEESDDEWNLDFDKKDLAKPKQAAPVEKPADSVHIDFFGTDQPKKAEEVVLKASDSNLEEGMFGNELEDLEKEFNQLNDKSDVKKAGNPFG